MFIVRFGLWYLHYKMFVFENDINIQEICDYENDYLKDWNENECVQFPSKITIR